MLGIRRGMLPSLTLDSGALRKPGKVVLGSLGDLRQPGPLRPPLSSNGDNLIPPEKPWDFTCFSGIF